MSSGKIIFITGTDTGVGKTLLTALLLHHLRSNGINALATKPFCSGGLGDVKLLQSLQPGELSDAEMNPFYFKRPVAPLAATLGTRRKIKLGEVVKRIRSVARQCDILLVEGSGGLLVPLGENYTVADLISRLDCEVFVASRNRLGTINHTLLTVTVLESMGIARKRVSVVMMSSGKGDISSRTNQRIIARMARPAAVFCMPFLGKKADRKSSITAKNLVVKRELNRLLSGKIGLEVRFVTGS